MTTPLHIYQEYLSKGDLQKDPEQARAMTQLEHIYHELILRQRQRNSQLGRIRRKIKPRQPIHGLYLWGKVGTGKTFLVDIFYDCLPTSKIRMHFHQFMQKIHGKLKEYQGRRDPLNKIAKEIADSTVVLVFDEFEVSNIADAMILGTLFRELFYGGVCLIATSNVEPGDLYKNGLQRQRFLPAIKLVKKYVETMHVTTIIDYRQRELEQADIYYCPLGADANKLMAQKFRELSQGGKISTKPLIILDREIMPIRYAGKVIWFNFENLCGCPRSQNDYLELIKTYQIILISNIPIFDAADRDLVKSFINLIDILYDAHTGLVVSAQAEPEGLYPEGPLKFEFRRTASRLVEMQSSEYFNTVPPFTR